MPCSSTHFGRLRLDGPWPLANGRATSCASRIFSPIGEIHADDFLVVVNSRKSRRWANAGWDQMTSGPRLWFVGFIRRPVDSSAAWRRQFGLNEIAMFVDEQGLAAVLDKKGRWTIGLRRLPKAVSQTCFGLRAPRHLEVPVTAHAVDTALLGKGVGLWPEDPPFA